MTVPLPLQGDTDWYDWVVQIDAQARNAQPGDADLTALAALAPADGAYISRVTGTWSARTPVQVRSDIGAAAAAHTHPVTDLATTGTASSSTYLNGGGAWANPALVPVSVKTASYTLTLADAGTAIEMNAAGANTLTVPTNAAVPIPVGAVIEVVQYGVGQTTIAGPGVTLRTSSLLTTRAQYSTVSLRKRAADEWIVAGDLT